MHFNLLDPIVVAAAVFFALWVLVRWGAPLLLLYALTRVCVGEWGPAVIAVLFAVLIELGNGFGSWLEWNAHGREAWLRRRQQDHARH